MKFLGIIFTVSCIILPNLPVGWMSRVKPSDFGYSSTSKQTDYILHTAPLSWNEARQICVNNGGTLAKIDSLQLHQAIYDVANSTYHTNILYSIVHFYCTFTLRYKGCKESSFRAGVDYYLSLIITPDGDFVWTSDCTLMRNDSHLFHAGADKECMRIKKDTFLAEDHDCSHTKPFLCQQETSTACEETNLFDNNYQYLPNTNASACAALCQQDPYCWSYVRYPIDMCVKIMVSGYGADGFQLVVKQCINVILDEDVYTNFTDDDNNSANDHNCEAPYNTTASFPTLPPISSNASYSPVQCYTKQTESVTQQVPVTVQSTVIEPTTVYVTSTVAVPTTITDTTVDLQSTAVTVTETVNYSVQATQIQPTTVYVPSTIVVHTTVTDVSTQRQSVSITVTETVRNNITHVLTPDELIEVESIAEEIAKNLTVDTRTTSSYVRTLTCAQDNRTSSTFVGYIGVVFVTLPMALIFLIDVRKLILDFRNPANMYRR